MKTLLSYAVTMHNCTVHTLLDIGSLRMTELGYTLNAKPRKLKCRYACAD